MATVEPIRVITGATAGIGLSLAKRLAAAGPIALVARDSKKAEAARTEIGSGVTANAVNPGLARTGLMRQASAPLRGVLRLMSAPVDKVADRIAPLLLDPAYASANGQFFHKGKPIDPPKSTLDVGDQHRLWQVSQQLTGLA